MNIYILKNTFYDMFSKNKDIFEKDDIESFKNIFERENLNVYDKYGILNNTLLMSASITNSINIINFILTFDNVDINL